MTTVTAGNQRISFDLLDLTLLWEGTVISATSSQISVAIGSGFTDTLFGSFTYNAQGLLTGGTVTRYLETENGQTVFDITGISVPVELLAGWAASGDNLSAKLYMLGGADLITGSAFDDILRGYAGGDSMNGGAGSDTLDGGSGADSVSGSGGNDSIVDESGANYLRGDDGNDSISGGSGFDDINGNMGDDTATGGLGDDWVVGGRDNDRLSGGDGGDIVYGNLGNDTADGGNGDDLIRGGQQNDSLSGGAGADWLSGDRDSDTMSGGSGADIFHTFGDAGVDRVLDFSRAEGDRVQLDPGTTWSVAQVGSDVVITMGGGGQMTLVGVSMASLTGDWIFGA